MPTTVHIPAALLARVDARAKSLRVSRNRLIISALESSVGPGGAWPPELVALLQARPAETLVATSKKMLDTILSARRNRRVPPRL